MQKACLTLHQTGHSPWRLKHASSAVEGHKPHCTSPSTPHRNPFLPKDFSFIARCPTTCCGGRGRCCHRGGVARHAHPCCLLRLTHVCMLTVSLAGPMFVISAGVVRSLLNARHRSPAEVPGRIHRGSSATRQRVWLWEGRVLTRNRRHAAFDCLLCRVVAHYWSKVLSCQLFFSLCCCSGTFLSLLVPSLSHTDRVLQVWMKLDGSELWNERLFLLCTSHFGKPSHM